MVSTKTFQLTILIYRRNFFLIVGVHKFIDHILKIPDEGEKRLRTTLYNEAISNPQIQQKGTGLELIDKGLGLKYNFILAYLNKRYSYQ